jgi:hypothetical protein
MALPGVNVNLQNGALPGSADGDDGLGCILLQGPAAASLALLTPRLISSLQDAIDLGLDADYDAAGEVHVYQHLRDFYAEAGAGRSVWIMLVSQAVTMATMVDVVEEDYARRLLDAAGGKARFLIVTRNPADGYALATVDDHIDADVVSAIGAAQELGEFYLNEFTPFRTILEGYGYDGDHGGLVDLKQRTDNRVGIVIGNTRAGASAAVGLVAGRLASIPVQRNLGRVLDGPVRADDIYLGTEEFGQVFRTAATIHDRGFITFRQHPGKAGFYISDDPVATNGQDDYRRLAYGRTIDKALRIAYTTYAGEILDEVEVDTRGRIEPVKAKYYQSLIERALNQAMTAQGEILSVAATVDLERNVLALGVAVDLRIQVYGYADPITINLGFLPINA